jgi:hypothetical protein
MAVQLGTNSRNARLDAIETTLGTAPLLTLRTGAQPTNCAAANSGTVLATINLPSDWMATASGGTKSILGGPWQDISADASGTAAHFRIHNTAGTTCEMQGSVGLASGDLQLDNNVLVAGQTVSITAFTLTDANS